MTRESIDTSTPPVSYATSSTSYDVNPEILAHETPHFTLEKVQLQFDLRNSLQRVLVANNIMYLLTASVIFRIDLNNPSRVSQISIPATPSDPLRIADSWVHPSGSFLLVKTTTLHYFHLHASYTKLKVLSRFKGLDVSSVAWTSSSASQSQNDTGDFLLSTTDGQVYAAFLKSHDPLTQENKRDDKHVKLVYLAKEPVIGISFSVQLGQIHLFLEGRVLAWDCFDPSLSTLSRSFKQAPVAKELPYSKDFSFHASSKSYYLLSSSGLLFSDDEEVNMSNKTSIHMEELGIKNGANSLIPSSHYLLFLPNDLSSLAIADKLMTLRPIIKTLPSSSMKVKFTGVSCDPIASTYWVYTDNDIYEVIVSNESAAVWYAYYKMGKYDEAYKMLDLSDKSVKTLFKKNVILTKQGYDFLQKGGFGLDFSLDLSPEDVERFELQRKGIRQIAKLQEPFEKVCLMLMNHEGLSQAALLANQTLLVDYLEEKLEYAKLVEKNKIKTIILSSWIVRLLLRLILIYQSDFQSTEIRPVPEQEMRESRSKAQSRDLEKKLDLFLKQNHNLLDQRTIFQLMKEMNFTQKLLQFAELLEDYKTIFLHHVENENWSASLKYLAKLYVKDKALAKDAILSTSTLMLLNSPKDTVDTWIRFPDFDYESLLPAILSYNKNVKSIPFNQNYSLQFLLKLIYEKNIKSCVLNNYYLSLLISYPSHEDDLVITNSITKALNFFKNAEGKPTRRGSLYNGDFLLRICLKFERYQPAVLILIEDMKLYEVALRLALEKKLTVLGEFVLRKFDEHYLQDLESENINFMIEQSVAEDAQFLNNIKLEDENFASRRKLWMIYAKYLVDGVCQGESFDIPGLSNIEKTRPIKEESNEVKNITNGIVQLMTNVSSEEVTVQSTHLNRVLQYLLNLSYSSNQNSNVLTLKDLLPLLPESVLIIHFKEKIVESLNLYNNRINQLGLEMQESGETTRKLKQQIIDSESKEVQGSLFTVIEPGESCHLCEKLLLNKNFVVFPNCHHAFHRDCMIRYYLQSKGDYRFKKIFQTFKQTSSLAEKGALDELLLKECLLCNESNINSIEDPLLSFEKKTTIDEWTV